MPSQKIVKVSLVTFLGPIAIFTGGSGGLQRLWGTLSSFPVTSGHSPCHERFKDHSETSFLNAGATLEQCQSVCHYCLATKDPLGPGSRITSSKATLLLIALVQV